MSKLPRISGRECIKVLGKSGFQFKRQEGSHIVLRRDNPFGSLSSLIIKSLTGERFVRLFGKQV